MAGQLNVDPDEMRAAARALKSFVTDYNNNRARGSELLAEFQDAFGGDKFGNDLLTQYSSTNDPLTTNGKQFGAAVLKLSLTAEHSSASWVSTTTGPNYSPPPVPHDTPAPKVKPNAPKIKPGVK